MRKSTLLIIALAVFAAGFKVGEWIYSPHNDYQVSFLRCTAGIAHSVIVIRRNNTVSMLSTPILDHNKQIKECQNESDYLLDCGDTGVDCTADGSLR